MPGCRDPPSPPGKEDERFLYGVIVPSYQTYEDVVGSLNEVDVKECSVHTYQSQAYSDSLGDYTTVLHHELEYKGEVVWKIETDSQTRYNYFGVGCTSRCCLSKGRLVVVVERRGGEFESGGSDFLHKRLFDVASIINGSATAYQSGKGVRNRHDEGGLATRSFSEFVVELNDETPLGEDSRDERSVASSTSSYKLSSYDQCASRRNGVGRVRNGRPGGSMMPHENSEENDEAHPGLGFKDMVRLLRGS